MHRRQDIQGIRAMAVLAVIAFHAGLPIPGGFTGVDIFFVISGFVITSMLNRELQQKDTFNLLDFYFRRFKRLMPALALVVACTMLLSVLLLTPQTSIVKTSAWTGIGAILTVANVTIATRTGGYFDSSAESNPLLNTWSLSVEEQFYFFFPVVLLASHICARRGKLWRYFPIVVVALLGITSFTFAVIGHSYIGLSSKLQILFGFYSPITRAWEFAAGVGLAFAGSRFSIRSVWLSQLFVYLGLILIGIGFFVFSGKTPWPGISTLLPVVGTIFLIHAGTLNKDARNVAKANFLSTKIFVFLGNISYSWYLWHWPLIALAGASFGYDPFTLSCAAVVSLIPAITSYYYLENPIRQCQIKERLNAVILVVSTILPAIVICMLVLYANIHHYGSDKIKAFQQSVDQVHVSNASGCGQGYVSNTSSDTTCLWNADGRNKPIYLIGDSNADHVSEGVIAASKQLDRPVKIFTKGGCSFLGSSWSDQTDVIQNNCLQFVANVLMLLKKSDPGIVIVGMSDSIWSRGPSVGPTRSDESNDPKIAHPYLQADLILKINQIKNDGHQVILLQPVPKFIGNNNEVLFDHAKCNTISILYEICPKKISIELKYAQALQRAAREAISKAALLTDSSLIDLQAFFCPQTICSNKDIDGQLLYRDAGHLSVQASLRLTNLFTSALRKE